MEIRFDYYFLISFGSAPLFSSEKAEKEELSPTSSAASHVKI